MKNSIAQNMLAYRFGFGKSFGSASGPVFPNLLPAPKLLEVIGLHTMGELGMAPKLLSKSGREEFLKIRREQFLELNNVWLDQMLEPEHMIREKMTLFWHDHFAVRILHPYLAQQHNNILRTHALGSFADMLFAVSQDAAMLQFLNNQQNKKGHPNENFARELFELYTMGRGHYTENDIQEAARAFTGWGFNTTGQFRFRRWQHDAEEKTVLGLTGRLGGADVLERVLEQKQTAYFITNKIVTYFTGQRLAESYWKPLANEFYTSGYRIDALLKSLARQDWIIDPRVTGQRVKSPIELITSWRLHLPGVPVDRATLPGLQRLLGQVAFFPPSVNGWTSGKGWLDGSTLVSRLLLPSIIAGKKNDRDIPEIPEDQLMQMGLVSENRYRNSLRFSMHWEKLEERFYSLNPEELLQKLEQTMLAVPLQSDNRRLVMRQIKRASSHQEKIINAMIIVCSLPEYQLS